MIDLVFQLLGSTAHCDVCQTLCSLTTNITGANPFIFISGLMARYCIYFLLKEDGTCIDFILYDTVSIHNITNLLLLITILTMTKVQNG